MDKKIKNIIKDFKEKTTNNDNSLINEFCARENEDLKLEGDMLNAIETLLTLSEEKGYEELSANLIYGHITTNISDDKYLKQFKSTWMPTGELISNLILKNLNTIESQEFGAMRPLLDWWFQNGTRQLIFLHLIISRAQLEQKIEKDPNSLKHVDNLMILVNDYDPELISPYHSLGGLSTIEDFNQFQFLSKKGIREEIKKAYKKGYVEKWEGQLDRRKKAYSIKEETWIEFRHWIHDLINLENNEYDAYVENIISQFETKLTKNDKKHLTDILRGSRFNSRINLFLNLLNLEKV